MRPPLHSRLLAIAWAVLATVAVPGLAVAHGTAHHDLVGAEHEHAPVRGVASADDHDAGEHAHPEISPISSGRTDLPAFMAAEPVAIRLAHVLIVAVAPLFEVTTSPDTSPPDSPRQPRAPPLG